MRSSVSRREFMLISGLVAAGLPLGATVQAAPDKLAMAVGTDEILARLLEGNKRYVKGALAHPRRKPEDFAALAEGQNPVAVIVGCADSRVAPELIFDQGVGDLFVVRVAGNVISGAGASVKGSIEYAVVELGVRLIMVLGHSQCGAIKAAIQHIDAKDALPGSIGELVATIKPAVTAVKGNPGDPLDNVIKANVERGVERLKGLEPILADAVKKRKVNIVGATYDLRSGKVMVFG
jgi:carbonic anhydrase